MGVTFYLFIYLFFFYIYSLKNILGNIKCHSSFTFTLSLKGTLLFLGQCIFFQTLYFWGYYISRTFYT